MGKSERVLTRHLTASEAREAIAMTRNQMTAAEIAKSLNVGKFSVCGALRAAGVRAHKVPMEKVVEGEPSRKHSSIKLIGFPQLSFRAVALSEIHGIDRMEYIMPGGWKPISDTSSMVFEKTPRRAGDKGEHQPKKLNPRKKHEAPKRKKKSEGAPSVDEICTAVADMAGMNVSWLVMDDRNPSRVRARQIARYIAMEYGGVSSRDLSSTMKCGVSIALHGNNVVKNVVKVAAIQRHDDWRTMASKLMSIDPDQWLKYRHAASRR